MAKSKILILFLIVLLAGFFRFFKLDTVPPSLYWDEVSQGYNAYLISTAGEDEHQESYPLARFQAFGDYKAPVNIYLTAVAISLFGKSDFAVRLPSAALGALTVLSTFLLVYFLFYKKKYQEWYGLLAALFLAISPWHIQLSRAAFEANIATFFTVTGAFLFFYALRRNPWMLMLAGISFVLGFYSFNAHRIFIPLLVILFTLVEYQSLQKVRKQVVLAAVIGFVMLVPFALYFSTPESKLRFQEVNIFSDISIIKKANELIKEDGNTLFARIIHNRRILFTEKYLTNYFSFFDPKFLFLTGDENPRFSDQMNGQLFLFMLPFLICGLYALFWQKREFAIVIGWLALAPIAAATAREVPHALRSETFLPTFSILAGVGVVSVFIYLRQYVKKYSLIFPIILSAVIFLSCLQFWHDYLTHNPIQYSEAWQYGYKSVIAKVWKIEKNYDQIYFTNAYGRPYIYVAWYENFLPDKFWSQVRMQKDPFGFYNVDRLGKYIFTKPPAGFPGKILFVTTPDQVPMGTRTLDTVKFLDGKTAFVISEKV